MAGRGDKLSQAPPAGVQGFVSGAARLPGNLEGSSHGQSRPPGLARNCSSASRPLTGRACWAGSGRLTLGTPVAPVTVQVPCASALQLESTPAPAATPDARQ
ncbi:hypothetical protein VFPFJ_01835 [Purpureocillium lilacinum]|uniref:Uncharacterized protein n=1 Tax=Purpureocillium lilacinum TaxID=33203 RepID=A0A179HRM2_PURLI|nr:hypothetical protein VFPFJ_01835 [Purpureocillium lilacinum]OAQ92674.1 hypothetical protein VFPFJ_01835 [Purpureocillium lilacinum]